MNSACFSVPSLPGSRPRHFILIFPQFCVYCPPLRPPHPLSLPWLQTPQKPEASGCGCPRPSLIWHSHCLSQYTNFLFVARFRSVLAGNFLFLWSEACAVSPPRLPSPDRLRGLHPLFNAEEIDDLGEKIFSFETKTLVMPDRTKIHWTLLWRTLISTRHSVRLIIINIGSQNNNKGPMTRTDHSSPHALSPSVIISWPSLADDQGSHCRNCHQHRECLSLSQIYPHQHKHSYGPLRATSAVVKVYLLFLFHACAL